MKRIVFLSLLAFAALFQVSCKKCYTCTVTVQKDNDPPETGSQDYCGTQIEIKLIEKEGNKTETKTDNGVTVTTKYTTSCVQK